MSEHPDPQALPLCPSADLQEGGPCRGGLVKIALTESDGMVHWHTAQSLKPVDF